MGKDKFRDKQKKLNDGKGKKDITEQAGQQELSNDTIFIRNLSFETEEETLKQFICDNFGETVYCLICKDKETDESKGTAFAKFKEPENAKKCLEEFKDRDLQTKFHLDGRNLIVLPALSKEKIQENKSLLDKKATDKRNLGLAKEGFIHALADEAKELSKSDLEKRKVLDMRKKELLKNLHNFVSDTRLCIHNLPPSVDDQKLRKIFFDNVKEACPGCKIIECKVMRNKMGGGKLGTSKGFAFVGFSKHEHALAALRKINNNPKVFSKDKRPIVEFSIENMVALNKKKTRLASSLRKNLKSKQGAPAKGSQQVTNKKEKVAKGLKKKIDLKKMKRKATVKFDSNEEENVLKKIKKAVNDKLKQTKA